MDPLRTNLLDLLFALDGQRVPITVGGGFGLFLKRHHLTARGERTLFAELPEPRATNDIDVFLRADVLTDVTRSQAVAAAIRGLGYEPVAGAEYLQWRRAVAVGGVAQEVKIDLLVGPTDEHRSKLHVNPPRVRPKGKSVGLHAYETKEALYLEDRPVSITVSGTRSGGEAHTATVFVPEAFPYLMMKLFAFDDRQADANKDLGRHHALDLYTIVGMMTEGEYDRARQLGEASRSDDRFVRGCAIVGDHFGTPTSAGVLRLREHRLFRDDFRLGEFFAVLGEIFHR
jgi:hypothetical protein